MNLVRKQINDIPDLGSNGRGCVFISESLTPSPKEALGTNEQDKKDTKVEVYMDA